MQQLNLNRVEVTTLLGFILGAAMWAGKGLGMSLSPNAQFGGLTIVAARTVLGFAIGISAWRTRWWIHGTVLGFVFSLPTAFGALWVGLKWFPDFFIMLTSGIITGIMIEALANLILKVKTKRAGAESPQQG